MREPVESKKNVSTFEALLVVIFQCSHTIMKNEGNYLPKRHFSKTLTAGVG